MIPGIRYCKRLLSLCDRVDHNSYNEKINYYSYFLLRTVDMFLEGLHLRERSRKQNKKIFSCNIDSIKVLLTNGYHKVLFVASQGGRLGSSPSTSSVLW